MHITISWFGILITTLLFLTVGLGVIKLLSILGNAILGRKPATPAPVQRVSTAGAPRKGFPFLMVFGIGAFVLLLSIRATVRLDSNAASVQDSDIVFTSTSSDSEVRRALTDAAKTIRKDLAEADSDVGRSLREALKDIDDARKQVRDAIGSETGTAAPDPATVAETASKIIASSGAAIQEIAESSKAGGLGKDDFVVLKLSPAALAELVGERRSEVLKSLRERLPEQQQHTFALIQLSAPGAENAAPAITPFVVAEKLTNLAVSFADIVDEEQKAEAAAAAAVATETAAATTDTTMETTTETTVEPETSADVASTETEVASTEPALSPATAPAWLKETPPGKIHVKTSFFPEGETGEQELQDVIRKSIQEELRAMDSKYLRPEFLHHLLSIKVDDRVVDACVAGDLKYEEQEPVTTGSGTLTMKRIHALVSVPESVRRNAQEQIEAAIRQNRADVLAMSMGLMWCAVVAGAVGVKIGRKGRAMRYLIATPLVLLLGIPLLAASIGVVTASATGQYVSVPWNDGQIVVQVTQVEGETANH